MKDAKALLLDVLAAIPDGKKVAALFAEDGAVELPFLHSVGIESRFEGAAAIEGFYDLVKQLYPDFAFKPEDTHVLIETPDQVFAEYTAHTTAAGTGRLIHHLFAARLVAENGKIKLLRESLNVVAAAQALNPNGLADLPAFTDEIFSVKPGYQS
ncbi:MULTISPECIES: nuclear transport factor 2 family protein [unclassified Pseudomonas]|uniref:nuclear transport factor 2 family protein n=1 Tax=unclassified Pseudomonas TaxID=196821 RepID=UPI00384D323A